MEISAVLGAVALAAGIVTGAAVQGKDSALQHRQTFPGKDKISAPGDDRTEIYRPIKDSGIACSMVNVRQSGISNAIRSAIEANPIGRPFTAYNIASEVYETDFVYYGKVQFTVTWVPSETFSGIACPDSNPAKLFDMMVDEYQQSCDSHTQFGPYDFPRVMRQEYSNCGTLEVFHDDSISEYEDVLARPGFLVCGGKDKLFQIESIMPLIRTFCEDFVSKSGVVDNKAKMLHKHTNIQYEPGPFSGPSLDVVRTSDLNIFAAFDKDACSPYATEPRWPSEEECIANLDPAINASGNVGMCSRECSLTADREGTLDLGYCDEFHDPTMDKTQGGYTWSDCFRWGVVDDLKEGVLGNIMLVQKEE